MAEYQHKLFTVSYWWLQFEQLPQTPILGYPHCGGLNLQTKIQN